MSSEGWKKVQLGDILTLHYGKALVSHDRNPGFIPVYSSSGITGWHDKPLVNDKGIIIGRKGNVGSIYYSDTPFYCIDTAYYVTPDDTDVDFMFLYYLLQTLGLNGLNEDSAVPGLNRETALAQWVNIPVEKQIQNLIANQIAAFDEKIKLNRQTNSTLEAIAQAIFKGWFVDFNYPGATGEMIESELGLIPKGWSVKPLDEIATFLNGLALQKYPPENENEYLPVIKIRELKHGVTESSDRASRNLPKDYIIQDGDLLFSWSGSLEVKFWVGGEGALNQHLFKVTSENYPLWFCYHWILHHLTDFRNIAEEKTTTMGHIKREHLSDALCLVPENIDPLDAIIQPIFSKMLGTDKECQLLIKTRELLLPELMTGRFEL